MAGLPRPTALPEWASAAQNNGPNGEPNIIEPSLSKKQRGWDALEFPPRNYFNWWMNLVYQWTCYLRDERDDIRADVDNNIIDIAQLFSDVGDNDIDIAQLFQDLSDHEAFAGTAAQLGHVRKAVQAEVDNNTSGPLYLDPSQLAAEYLKIENQPASLIVSGTVNNPSASSVPSSFVSYKIARMHNAVNGGGAVRLESNGGTITLFDDALFGTSDQRSWLILCYGRTNTGSNGGNTYKGMRITNSGGGIILDRPSGINANWVDGNAPVFDAHFLTNGEVPANGILNCFIENRACDYICAIPMSVGYNT